jgi:hypothetical protein
MVPRAAPSQDLPGGSIGRHGGLAELPSVIRCWSSPRFDQPSNPHFSEVLEPRLRFQRLGEQRHPLPNALAGQDPLLRGSGRRTEMNPHAYVFWLRLHCQRVFPLAGEVTVEIQ